MWFGLNASHYMGVFDETAPTPKLPLRPQAWLSSPRHTEVCPLRRQPLCALSSWGSPHSPGLARAMLRVLFNNEEQRLPEFRKKGDCFLNNKCYAVYPNLTQGGLFSLLSRTSSEISFPLKVW